MAGLELGRFEAAAPTLWPPSFADERRFVTGVAYALAGYGWWAWLAGRPLLRNTPLES